MSNAYTPNDTPVSSQTTKPLEQAKEEASKLKNKVSEEAHFTGQTIKEETKSAVGSLKEATKRYASDQQQALSTKTRELSDALGAAADRLQDSNEPNLLAGPAQDLSAQVSKLADYLGSKSPEDLMQGLSGMAKRKPELVFGGLFLAGLMGARFLKASGKKPGTTQTHQQISRQPELASLSEAFDHSTQLSHGY